MRRILFCSAILVLMFSSGCGIVSDPAESVDSQSLAAITLQDYFEHLSAGRFEQGAALYGGSPEILQQNNPQVDPEDLTALFESACQFNMQCLPVRQIVGSEEVAPGEVLFQVEFEGPDGETFVLGPCCGASEEEMPPQSVFEIRVHRTPAGDFEVLDLPVYVP